ncbi:hypothetical protein [Demequina zhanjiangensis]|uniref:Lipoprotein n=1 Tax=Demequina zhanjiangensis TaxID=3051659 RepID=A0ABT8G1R9_9MICO|nr:hypothetical protein [Demequina sp. SYSU T00b26]MDN4473022.1 hypothetical protein [Demequina sp. SYSU T00b26]
MSVNRWAVRAVVVASAAVCLAACSDGSDARIPEVAEAESLIARAYDAREDTAALCDLSSSLGNCKALLQGAGTAPTAEPEVVCTQPYEGHDSYTPGLLVRTVTVDDSGLAVTHDTVAIDTPGGARLMNVVYWEPWGVSDGNTTEDTVEFDC